MSNSQKYINIVSILNIIAGAIFIVLGIADNQIISSHTGSL